MNPKLHNLFANALPAPAGLEARIMARVRSAARRRNAVKAIIGSVASALFAVALVFAGREAVTETAMTGFGQYLSLAFTDSRSILSDWRDFVWTLVESAPVMGLALSLAAAGMLTAAVRWTGRAFSGFSLYGGARA